MHGQPDLRDELRRDVPRLQESEQMNANRFDVDDTVLTESAPSVSHDVPFLQEREQMNDDRFHILMIHL